MTDEKFKQGTILYLKRMVVGSICSVFCMLVFRFVLAHVIDLYILLTAFIVVLLGGYSFLLTNYTIDFTIPVVKQCVKRRKAKKAESSAD